MSIKTIGDLDKVLLDLQNDAEWNGIPQDVRNELIKEYHQDLAECMLHDAVKKQQQENKPKRNRKKPAKKEEDGGDTGNNTA